MPPEVLSQLAIGAAGTVGSAVAHIVVVLLGRLLFERPSGGGGPLAIAHDTLRLAFITLWLLLAHAAPITIWVGLFLWLGAFSAVEPALYFTLSGYTTLGFGDVNPPLEWRLLSGFVGATGFLLFGLSVAILVDATHRLRLRRPD